MDLDCVLMISKQKLKVKTETHAKKNPQPTTTKKNALILRFFQNPHIYHIKFLFYTQTRSFPIFGIFQNFNFGFVQYNTEMRTALQSTAHAQVYFVSLGTGRANRTSGTTRHSRCKGMVFLLFVLSRWFCLQTVKGLCHAALSGSSTDQLAKEFRRDPIGNRAIFVFSRQKSCTRIMLNIFFLHFLKAKAMNNCLE